MSVMFSKYWELWHTTCGEWRRVNW